MRTTLTIDDDVLTTAKEIATRQHKSVGEVISGLVRQALAPAHPVSGERNGIALLAVRPRSAPVTLELVNQLRDELP